MELWQIHDHPLNCWREKLFWVSWVPFVDLGGSNHDLGGNSVVVREQDQPLMSCWGYHQAHSQSLVLANI